MSNSFRIITINSCQSTNSYASELIKDNPKQDFHKTVIYTQNQILGRGQGINGWESEPGKNLTFSIIYNFEIDASQQYDISKIATLSIVDFLNPLVKNIRIKWPNDIYIDNKKISGILIENFVRGNLLHTSIIGIGINLNQTIFLSDAPNPVSLKQLTNTDINLNNSLLKIISNFDNKCTEYFMSENKITAEFSKNLFRINQKSEFITNGIKFTGTITGVNSFGQLLISKENGELTVFNNKEIEFVL